LAEERKDNREEISERRKSAVLSCRVYLRVWVYSHAPEQIEKPKHLHQHPDSRPLEEHEEDAAEETGCPAQFVPPREEVERLLRADDEE
jgi:hypothetical protein